MKETDIIDPVRIGKFSLGYFRWSVTAHIFQPKRFWKYCTKQVYEWKRGLSLQFISLTGIYTLLMFIFHTDGQPFITSSGAQMLIWLGFFIYIAKSSSSLADQIGIRSKRNSLSYRSGIDSRKIYRTSIVDHCPISFTIFRSHCRSPICIGANIFYHKRRNIQSGNTFAGLLLDVEKQWVYHDILCYLRT